LANSIYLKRKESEIREEKNTKTSLWGGDMESEERED